MVRKEDKFCGKTEREMRSVSFEDFLEMAGARVRRSFKRGLSDAKKDLMVKVKDFKEGKRKKPVKTHLRDMIIVPEMLGQTIHVYTGKDFKPVIITVEKLGRYLGEFALTRTKITHSAPGVGATKSSGGVSKK